MEGMTAEEEAQARREISQELFGGGTTEKTEVLEPERVKEEIVKPKNEDPWTGVNPALKSEFEFLKEKAGQFDTLADRLKQAEKRIGSVTNELSESKKASEKAKEEAAKAPTQEEIASAAQSAEDWEALKDEFPTWAGAMDKRFIEENKKTEKALKIIDNLKTEIETLKESRLSPDIIDTKIADLKTDYARTFISISHKGWMDTLQTKEWAEWKAVQSAEILQKCASDNPLDAISVLDKFKEETESEQPKKTVAEIAAERKKRLEAAELPNGNRSRQSVKTENNMTDDEYRQKAAKEIWKT